MLSTSVNGEPKLEMHVERLQTKEVMTDVAMIGGPFHISHIIH
jgi:hypothetical protein